jgi:hypothetical protein
MTLPESTQSASVTVYTLEGRQRKSIPVIGRGDTSVIISDDDLTAGIYLYGLSVDGKSWTRNGWC